MSTLYSVLHKQLDESTPCPLCRASMWWVEAEQHEQPVEFHECSFCEHRLFKQQQHTCHCESCGKSRKKILKETRLQEQRKYKNKQTTEIGLDQLNFCKNCFY